MNRQDFEHVIKKDIRNNPIIREIDYIRQRELWRSVAIGIFVVSVLLFSAWQHFELLQHGYRIEQMEQQRALELETNRYLRLEVETLRSPERIERIATEQLNLVVPASDQAIVVERVVPAAYPDGAVVVRRQGTKIGKK